MSDPSFEIVARSRVFGGDLLVLRGKKAERAKVITDATHVALTGGAQGCRIRIVALADNSKLVHSVVGVASL